MNDALLIQHASADWDGVNMLRVTTARHIEYCQRHRFDYEMIISGESPKYGDWAKVQMIRTAMEVKLSDGERQYNYIVYLDVDTLIADMKADLRDGCVEKKIGCCRHVLTNPPYNINLDHLNVGALYLQNTEENRANVDRWLAGAPGTKAPPWWEQGVLNELEIGAEIDAKWNATGQVNPSPAPVVLGFHGQGDSKRRFLDMCSAVEKLTGRDVAKYA